MAQQRKMPSCKTIIRYWEDTLVDKGKVDDGELMLSFEEPRTGICFACGWIRQLDRAHIKARVEGGSDEPDNLHLLCHWCHQASEYKEGDEYWDWFDEQNMYSSSLAIAIMHNPSLIHQVYGNQFFKKS